MELAHIKCPGCNAIPVKTGRYTYTCPYCGTVAVELPDESRQAELLEEEPVEEDVTFTSLVQEYTPQFRFKVACEVFGLCLFIGAAIGALSGNVSGPAFIDNYTAANYTMGGFFLGVGAAIYVYRKMGEKVQSVTVNKR